MPVSIQNMGRNEYYKLVYNQSAQNFCVTLDKLDVPFSYTVSIQVEDQTTNLFGAYSNTFDTSQTLFYPYGLQTGKTWNDCWDTNELQYRGGQNLTMYRLYTKGIDLGTQLTTDTEYTVSWEHKEFMHSFSVYYSANGSTFTQWNKDTQYTTTRTYNISQISWEGTNLMYMNIDGKWTNWVNNDGGQQYWKRVGVTFKLPAGTRYVQFVWDFYQQDQKGFKRGGWVRNFQLEAKPYPTSFVSGNRPNGCLDIPFNLKDNFVISFWFKPRWKWDQTIYTTAYEQTYNLLTWGNPGTSGFLFRRTSSALNLETYQPTVSTSFFNLSDLNTINRNGFVHFVIIKSGTTTTVYANGSKIITNTNNTFVTPAENYIRIGARDTGNSYGRQNGLFADLFIGKYDPNIWTDQFIKKIYDSAKPFNHFSSN